MFKDLYKDANNSIPANDELLQELLKKADAPVKIRKFRNIYKIASVAAAVLIIAVFAASLNLIPKHSQNEKAEDSYAYSGFSGSPDKSYSEAVSNADNETSGNKVNETTGKADNNASVSEEKLSFAQADTSNTKESTVQSSAIGDDASKDSSSDALAAGSMKIAAKDESADAGGSGVSSFSLDSAPDSSVGIAARIMSSDFTSVDVYEYYRTFGIELSSLALPDGVTLYSNIYEVPSDESGNAVFAQNSLEFFGDGKRLILTISKDNAAVLSEIQSSPGILPNISIKENGGYYTAYVSCGSFCFMAECYNFSYEEAEALALSIKTY